jgi:pSer/pThr/pTyr-binding forkhead associated (FHA) protein
MKFKLTVSEGRPRTVLVDSSEFLIGRGADCDLKLENPMISRHHCVLRVHDGAIHVRDLGSTHGTGINNQCLVGERPLRDGDRLWVAVIPIEVSIQEHRGWCRDGVFRPLDRIHS